MKGQGIVEVVYSIGILGLMMTGVVILILITVANKKNDFDRKKATELGDIVLEEMINESKNNVDSFWSLTNVSSQTRSGFDGYTYSIGYSNISGNYKYPNCGISENKCVEAVVGVTWQGKNPQTVWFNRFFSKNAN